MSGVTIPTSSTNSSFNLSGITYIEALLGGIKWGGDLGTSINLTYSFPYSIGSTTLWANNYSDVGEPLYGPSGLNTTQQVAAEAALKLWANVANINFSKVAETTTTAGDIRFAFTNAPGISNVWGWAYYPDNTNPIGGDIWINPEYKYASFAVGSYNFIALLHELGHTLGLKHPFEDGVTLPSSYDSYQYSLMSYTDHPHSLFLDVIYSRSGYRSNYSTIVPQTPMLYDIAAMQYLYGANTSYRTGDDTYGFDAVTPFFMTIWDAGGNDTISVGNFSKGCIINLQAGQFSKITIESDPIPAGAVGWALPTYDGTDNLAIAFGVTIENAIGGSGNDTLIGNESNNSLTGGAGNDVLDGGAGLDISIYGESRSALTITMIAANSYRVTGIVSGSDSLQNIERLRCSDVAVALDISDNPGKAYRLYQAAFDRIPDLAGLGFWINAVDNGANLVSDVATGFLQSAEFAIKYGSDLSSVSYVSLLYNNVLHRLPEQSGYDFWVSTLAAGANWAEVLYGFSESVENQANVAPLIANGITYQEWLG